MSLSKIFPPFREFVLAGQRRGAAAGHPLRGWPRRRPRMRSDVGLVFGGLARHPTSGVDNT